MLDLDPSDSWEEPRVPSGSLWGRSSFGPNRRYPDEGIPGDSDPAWSGSARFDRTEHSLGTAVIESTKGLPPSLDFQVKARLVSSPIGAYYKCTGDQEVEEALSAYVIDPDEIYAIPPEAWQAMVAVCRYYLSSKLEVSFRLIVNDNRDIRVLVPAQSVGSASVDADMSRGCFDLLSGEIVEEYPPEGWFAAGSVHSHVDFQPTPSAVDDRSELKDSGLHLIIGNMRLRGGNAYTYEAYASVTNRGVRYPIDPGLVAPLDPGAVNYQISDAIAALLDVFVEQLRPRPLPAPTALPPGATQAQPPRLPASSPEPIGIDPATLLADQAVEELSDTWLLLQSIESKIDCSADQDPSVLGILVAELRRVNDSLSALSELI